jgi:hypothetical protein
MGCASSSQNPHGELALNRAPAKAGVLADWHVPGFMEAQYRALVRAEIEIGEPVFYTEVFKVFKRDSYFLLKHPLHTIITLRELYLTDRVMCNMEQTVFTVDPKNQSTAEKPTDFELYSDRMARIANTYIIDNALLNKIRPGP